MISRYRYRLGAAFAAAAAVGALSRMAPLGCKLWDKYLGDVVYAMVFYLFLSLLYSRGSIVKRSLITAVYVVAIECFQLTGIASWLYGLDHRAISFFVYVVLGSSFSWWDILAYAAGIAAIATLDQYMFITSRNSDRIKEEVCS